MSAAQPKPVRAWKVTGPKGQTLSIATSERLAWALAWALAWSLDHASEFEPDDKRYMKSWGWRAVRVLVTEEAPE